MWRISKSEDSPVCRYGCAFLSVVLAVLIRRLLDPALGSQYPFATVFLAVIVTAYYGGFRPALTAVVLGAIASVLFLLPGHALLTAPGQLAGLVLYLLTAFGISALAGSMHAARHQAKQDAEASRRQAALMDQIYDPVLAWEWNGLITFWNRGAERLYGFSAEEARGQVSHYLLNTSVPGGVESVVRTLERDGVWEGELRHTGKDGRAIIVASRMLLVRDASPAYVIEANCDITERENALNLLREAHDLLDVRVSERTTELARTNERLRAAEDQNRLILQGVHSHAIFMLDPVGNVASWNPGAERTKGYKAEEVIGQHFSQFFTPEDILNGNPGRQLQIASTQGYFEEEGTRVRKDGSRFYAIATIAPLFNSASRLLGFVLVTRDISKRKRIEDALRESEERFRLLVDGVSDYAILMLDPEGRILTWSQGAERIDGYAADEILGRHYSCLFTAESIASGEPERELERAATVGKVDIEGWRIRKNGSRFWVTGTLAALRDASGKVQGFAKITRDFTAKRQNDELLRSVLDNTLDGIIGINDRGTISMINRAGEMLFGCNGAEIIGQNVRTLMPEPYRSEHDGYLSNYLRTGDAKVIGIGREVQGLRKDGSVFPVDLAVTEFQLDNARYFVGIVRDISERKRLEAQLRQSQKMEAFGQLAGGVAHDFNNLLTVIKGYSDMLLMQLPANEPKARMVDQIRLAGERAAALTRQLLAFSRRQVLELKVLDINAVVTHTGEMLRRLIGEDVQFTTVLSPGVRSVRFDPGQIEQVIMNLAVNARDAMPQGGRLTIETADIDIDDLYTKLHPDVAPGAYVMLAVSDTGCGMTPEVKSRIFEPFFTTKAVGKGTGLGLAVVDGIVRQSAGSIVVYSEPGKGTTFRIFLPAVLDSGEGALSSGPEPSYSGTETVLLVEDEDSVREFVALALRQFGYTVLTASGAEAAIQLMTDKGGATDILVTDVVMPEISGRQLAETLQARFAGLKVLFLSGYTDDVVVRHGVLAASAAFLAKPFSSASLARKVRQVLDERRS